MNAAAPRVTLADWLVHLEGLHPKGHAGIEMGLERVCELRDALHQQPWCPVITVAGTNGKGSTCAYLENVLLAAGYRVGCYTSPHLHAYNERMRLQGHPIDDASLCAAFARVEAVRNAADGASLTYFEFGTLAAWEVFAAAGVEVLILEVGLGGRLDAVNAYESDVAIITAIDLDHQEWLGPDRDSIGAEKAGICRPGKPVFCADPHPPRGLLDTIAAIGADLRRIGEDFGFQRDAENRMQWRWWNRTSTGVVRRNLAFPGLRGSVQLQNASVALAALECLADQLPVSMQAVREGLICTELPGRFQVLPGKPTIVLDVGHNPQAIRVLAGNLGDMGFFERTHAVLGMFSDKDIAGVLAVLRGRVDAWYAATLEGPRGTSAEQLAATIRECDPEAPVVEFASPDLALRAALGSAGESDRILVFGSFYTVAGVHDALKTRH